MFIIKTFLLNNKLVSIAAFSAIILSLVIYFKFSLMKRLILENEVILLKQENETNKRNALTQTSNGMNAVKYDMVQESIDTVSFKEVILDDDYIDPDYGKTFTFGDE